MWWAAILGCAVGFGYAAWRAHGIPTVSMQFVSDLPLISKQQRKDQHWVLVWQAKGTLDEWSKKAAGDLTQGAGWQPMTELPTKPITDQFVRIGDRNGDFQFTRVTLIEEPPGTVTITLDQGPLQRGVLRKQVF